MQDYVKRYDVELFKKQIIESIEIIENIKNIKIEVEFCDNWGLLRFLKGDEVLKVRFNTVDCLADFLKGLRFGLDL